MNPPNYYSDWTQLLNQLKEPGQEDERILALLEQGTLEWTSGVADKIVNCTYEVIDVKLKYTTRLFQQELDHSRGEEASVIAAIVNARSRFDWLYRLCRLPVFPGEVRESLLEVVSKYVGDSQKALLESAKHDRSGQLAYAIKHNRLDQEQTQAPTAAACEPGEALKAEATSNPFTSRRRVLF